jgi:hypothetical protein
MRFILSDKQMYPRWTSSNHVRRKTNTIPPYPSTHTPRSSSLLAPSGTNRRRVGEHGFIFFDRDQHDSTIPLDSHTEILVAIGSVRYPLCGYGSLRYPLCGYLLPQVLSLWLLAPSGTLFVATGFIRYPLCGYWLPQVPSLWLLAP